MYVAERAVRRMFPPQGKPQEGAIYDPHGLDGVLAWMLPAVLRFLRCLHAIWEPHVSWGCSFGTWSDGGVFWARDRYDGTFIACDGHCSSGPHFLPCCACFL